MDNFEYRAYLKTLSTKLLTAELIHQERVAIATTYVKGREDKRERALLRRRYIVEELGDRQLRLL